METSEKKIDRLKYVKKIGGGLGGVLAFLGGKELVSSIVKDFTIEALKGKGFYDEAAEEQAVQVAIDKNLINDNELAQYVNWKNELFRENPIYLQNLTRLIQNLNKEATAPITEIKKGSGKKARTEKVPDPSWIQPGAKFIKRLAKAHDYDEFYHLLKGKQVLSLAPDGGFRKPLEWNQRLKEKDVYENIGKIFSSGVGATSSGVKRAGSVIANKAINAKEPAGNFYKKMVLLFCGIIGFCGIGSIILVIILGIMTW